MAPAARGGGLDAGPYRHLDRLGVVVGVAYACSRASGPAWLKWVVGTYVELIRNTRFIA